MPDIGVERGVYASGGGGCRVRCEGAIGALRAVVRYAREGDPYTPPSAPPTIFHT